MSETKRKYPFNFGRLFFPVEPNQKPEPIPNEIRFQPLDNHVKNVVELVKKWHDKDFPDTSSYERVKKAAQAHDIGKPQKFAIQVATDYKGKFKNYIYSFKGHRFLAKSNDAWAQTLAIGHHDYSVEDICRDIYTLKKEPQYADILTANPLAYAHELYILEMCDQIEAELACRVLGDEDQAESRTFMDYTITKDPNSPNTYLIDPWIFKEELKDKGIELTFEYWSMQPSEDNRTSLLECLDGKRDKKLGRPLEPKDLGDRLDQMVKTWWQDNQGRPEKQPSRKAILKPHVWTENSTAWNCDEAYQKLAGYAPNPMQKEMFEAIANTENPAILLKGPTGTGKTESILFPALTCGYRLFLPLPARSLLEDQKERIEKYLKKFSTFFPTREVSLVVDTGAQMRRWVYLNGEDISDQLNINPRRHLYKGDVILSTLDKFLYRYFAFGDKQKSFTFPFRIHRESKIHKTLICFDESHSYDEISFTNFQSLVQALYEAGRSLILMTATMPNDLIKRFDFLKENVIDFIDDDENREKLEKFQQQTLNRPYLNQRSFEWHNTIQCYQTNSEGQRDSIEFQNQVTKMILEQWELRGEATRILAVVETVKDAAAIYQQLKSTLNCDTSSENQWLFLYHGRIADKLRPELYKQIKHRDEKENPYIVVTTSAIEVGCDLNAEVLISQICPPENLIQRTGRCNRRGNISDAKVILVGDRIPDFANSLDDAGWLEYQKILQSLTEFDAQKIGSCISRSQHIDDYRVVELFSMLHDYVYSADLTCQPTHEKGLVITRSWTPSATLIYQNGEKEPPKITVPLDRLIQNEDNQYANTHVLESFYNQENTHKSERPLTFGSAYLKDIIIRISPNNKGAEMFDGKDEYNYNSELGFVDLPGVFIKLKSKNFDEKLLCQHDTNDKQKVAIISYTKGLNTETVLETQENASSN